MIWQLYNLATMQRFISVCCALWLESCSKYVISVSILLDMNGAELEEKFSTIQPMKAKLFYSQSVAKLKTIVIPNLR